MRNMVTDECRKVIWLWCMMRAGEDGVDGLACPRRVSEKTVEVSGRATHPVQEVWPSLLMRFDASNALRVRQRRLVLLEVKGGRSEGRDNGSSQGGGRRVEVRRGERASPALP